MKTIQSALADYTPNIGPSEKVSRNAAVAMVISEKPTGDLAALFDVSKPTMSTHFAALKEADLITADKVGVTINYHLNITVAEEAMSALMGVLGAGDAEAAPATPKRPATQKRKGAPS